MKGVYSIMKNYSTNKKRNKILQQRAKRKFQSLQTNFVNMTPHELVIHTDLGTVSLEKSERPIRVEYIYEPLESHPGFGIKLIAKRVNVPISGMKINYIVSRMCIFGMQEIGQRLLSKYGLQYWLCEQEIDIGPRFRWIGYDDLEKKWPEFKVWMNEHISLQEQREYYRELKRYIGRRDIWTPGPKAEDNQGNITGCKGLIQWVDDAYTTEVDQFVEEEEREVEEK